MLHTKGQLVNLVTVGEEAKVENLSVFHRDELMRWNMPAFKVKQVLYTDVF